MYADGDVTAEFASQNTPSGWTPVNLPNIPAITSQNTYDITDYGASTTSSDNTAAIQKALNAVGPTGGMVVIPKGEWLCGALTVKTKTVLHLAEGAMLKQLPYGVYDGGRKTGTFSNFITVSSSDVIIEGESTETSVMEGQGAPWWKAVEDKVDFKRGSMIRFTNGARYLVRNLRIQNTPGTNITLGQSGKASHFTVHDVTISNPPSGMYSDAPLQSHNTDGIPIWGPYANIYNCDISTGDDNIVTDSDARYIHVWDCKLGTGHGASLGSYTANMHDIIYERLTMENTISGFRLKSNSDRSGDVYNIVFRDVTMRGVKCPLNITTWYDSHPDPTSTQCTADASTVPNFHDILIQNVTATETPYVSASDKKRGQPLYVFGRKNARTKVTLDNVNVEATKGMFLAYCDVTFLNSCNMVNTKGGSAIVQQCDATITGNYTTGINAVTVSEQSDGKSYNLQGQLISENTKGLIIRGGRILAQP